MNFIEKRMGQRGQGGFTLIELLVTIAILAILAGVVVFAVGNSTKNARTASCLTERASIITAIEAANASNEISGNNESYSAYLESTPKFFTVSGQTATRTNTDTANKGVAPGDCAPIT